MYKIGSWWGKDLLRVNLAVSGRSGGLLVAENVM